MKESISSNAIYPGCKHLLSEMVKCHHTVFTGCEVLSETAIVAAALTLTLFHQSHIKKRSQHLNISKSSSANSREALSLSACLSVSLSVCVCVFMCVKTSITGAEGHKSVYKVTLWEHGLLLGTKHNIVPFQMRP